MKLRELLENWKIKKKEILWEKQDWQHVVWCTIGLEIFFLEVVTGVTLMMNHNRAVTTN